MSTGLIYQITLIGKRAVNAERRFSAARNAMVKNQPVKMTVKRRVPLQSGGAHLFGLPPCIVRTLCSDRRCVNGTARKTFFKSPQTALSSVKIRYINLAYHIYGRFINGNL